MTEPLLSTQDVTEAWNYWYPLVFGYFYRRLTNREDVEDLTANTLNALFLNPDVKNPKAYVWQTARLQLYKHLQQNKYGMPAMVNLEDYHILEEDEEYEEVLEASLPDVEYSDHYTHKIERLKECFKSQLSQEDYELMCGAVVEEKNSTQLGEQYNCKPGTVRQKIRRSFNKLREKCVELWTSLQAKIENPNEELSLN